MQDLNPKHRSFVPLRASICLIHPLLPGLLTRSMLTGQVLWRREAAGGGFLSVLEGQQGGARYRLLKADHSILGGAYVHPPQYAGQSVYGIFYLQEAVRYGTCA